MLENYRKEIIVNGFAVIENIFSESEIEQFLFVINTIDKSNPLIRKSIDLFAIRQFMIVLPEVRKLIFTKRFIDLIKQLFGEDYFLTKSIYFDKPEKSNWFVSYHQDLTISVDKRIAIEGFGPWTVKQNQFAVQPPLEILKDNFTLRIHLDDVNQNNGALNVIPGSHLKGIYRPETIIWESETETICCVKKGGVMIMKPLLLHSSKRTTNNQKRRVLHLEFSNQTLPDELKWSEQLSV